MQEPAAPSAPRITVRRGHPSYDMQRIRCPCRSRVGHHVSNLAPMPTYEYACRDCGHTFDAVQSIHDDSLTTCPECGGNLRRVVAAVGVHFKGPGFYRTDSRSGTGAGKSKGATAPAAGEAGGNDSADKSKSESSSTEKSGTANSSSTPDSGGASQPGAKKSGGQKSAVDKGSGGGSGA